MSVLNYLIKHKDKIRKKVLYIGLADLIKETILQAILKTGDMLPTETTLEENLQLSRITIRKALKLLEQQEIIIRHQGRGTFVTESRTLNLTTGLPSFTDNVRNSQHTPSERRLAHLFITFPDDICIKLQCPLETKGHFLKRVRMIDNIPIAFEEKWIPINICPEDHIIGASLYKTLSELNSMPIKFERQIYPKLASKEISEVLHIKNNTIILMLFQTGYRADGVPVEYGKVVCQQLYFS